MVGPLAAPPPAPAVSRSLSVGGGVCVDCGVWALSVGGAVACLWGAPARRAAGAAALEGAGHHLVPAPKAEAELVEVDLAVAVGV